MRSSSLFRVPQGAGLMPPKRKVPSNLAAARAKRHAHTFPTNDAADADASDAAAPPANTAAPTDTPASANPASSSMHADPGGGSRPPADLPAPTACSQLHPKPRGPVPCVVQRDGLEPQWDGLEPCSWDAAKGCWRAPDGSEHVPQRNPKRAAARAADREEAEEIDAEATRLAREAASHPEAAWRTTGRSSWKRPASPGQALPTVAVGRVPDPRSLYGDRFQHIYSETDARRPMC